MKANYSIYLYCPQCGQLTMSGKFLCVHDANSTQPLASRKPPILQALEEVMWDRDKWAGVAGTYAGEIELLKSQLASKQVLIDSYFSICSKAHHYSNVAGRPMREGETLFCMTCQMIASAKSECLKAALKAVVAVQSDAGNRYGGAMAEAAIQRLIDKEEGR